MSGHAQLGWSWLQDGRPDLAKRFFEMALDADPESTHAKCGLLHACQALGEGRRAEALAKALLSEHPDDPGIHMVLASHYFNEECHRKALLHAERWIELAPGDARALLVKAVASHELVEREEAGACLERARALGLEPSKELWACSLLLERGEHQRLAAIADEVLAVRPRDARALGARALLFESRGEFAKAIDLWRIVLAEHPCFDYAAWRIWILEHAIGAPPAGLGWLGWPARKLRLALGFRRLMFALWPLAAWFVPPSRPGIAVGVVASLCLLWTFEVVELPWRTWRSGWARHPGARRTQIAHLCCLAGACSVFAWAAWFGAWPMALASLAPLLLLSIHQGILRTSQPSHHDLTLEPLLVGLALLSLGLLAFGGDTAHRWGFWTAWVLASLVHLIKSSDWVLPTREDAAPQAPEAS